VFKAGRLLRVPLWRLVIHDYSKFSKAEWTPYANRFFGTEEEKTLNPSEFHQAWLHHLHNNPHHWEHWITPTRPDDPLRMPDNFVREMVADWLGAGRGITGKWDLTEWYVTYQHRHKLHSDVKPRVLDLLQQMDYGRKL